MNIEIKIEGKHDMNLIQRALDDTIEACLEDWGMEAQGLATEEISGIYGEPKRVDTGNLRGSIGYVVHKNEDTVYVGTNVEYAVWVHEGTGIYAAEGGGRQTPWFYKDEKGKWHFTRGMKPNRFLRNAIERHEQNYKDIADKHFQ